MRKLERRVTLSGLAATVALAAAMTACMWEGNAVHRDWQSAQPVAIHTPAGQVLSRAYAIERDTSPPLREMIQEQLAMRGKDKDADADADNPDAEADADDPDKVPEFALAPAGRGTSVPESDPVKAEYNLHGVPKGAAAVEQVKQGIKPPPELVDSFDGLGFGFEGPQGRSRGGNPSDNALAVGPDHIVQIVNSQMAIYTKKGKKYDKTGTVLFGPVNTNAVFRDFGDAARVNSGDAVVRYDQLADRWLIVLPIFSRLPAKSNEPAPPPADWRAHLSVPAVTGQPGPAATMQAPAPGAGRGGRGGAETVPSTTSGPATDTATAAAPGRGRGNGSYAMCYAVSATSDPLGPYYRYEYIRPLFPDYPRPAVWLDGYYVPTSTGDTVIQKQAFVVDRQKMLKGEDAAEQGFIIDGVNFLNNADVDGKQVPPAGEPNIMMAAGGHQLRLTRADGTLGDPVLEDDGIYYWKFHVDWDDPSKSKLDGPTKIAVAPYHHMCGGQLTAGVPQPGVARGLDSQGDKIMQRLVYRRIGDQESILAVHSVNATGTGAQVDAPKGGGGVRWYEFRLDAQRSPALYQQGTYCPDGNYRWMASPIMDSLGNIGIGYSFGGTPNFPGQRFAARNAGDPLGQMTLREAVLADGKASQAGTNRWQDYTTTCMDPSDDRTVWYVGDYLKEGSTAYTTRIGAFRIPNP